MPRQPDPKTRITPASFAIAPELLGMPLARPWRRALAMALDLIFIAILVHAGGLFFAAAAAFVLLRASAREKHGRRRPWVRNTIRFGGAFVLFIVVASYWGFWRGRQGAAGDADVGGLVSGADSTAGFAGGALHLQGLAGLGAIGDMVQLKRAGTDEAARRAADRFVAHLKEGGMSTEQMLDARSEMVQDASGDLPPRAVAALEAAFAAAAGDTAGTRLGTGAQVPRDSLARAYVARLNAHDTAGALALVPRVGSRFAADSLALLRARTGRLERSNATLRQQLATASEKPKSVDLVDTLANMGAEVVRLLKKAGLGFGWIGLYFTAFLALMNGQTPGKRLMGIRVRRLDGEPMGWWASFERFGGYSASIVTGLGGFFQILWDRNRQGLHDKVAETVVTADAGTRTADAVTRGREAPSMG